MKKIHITHSEKETKALAKKLAKNASGVITLTGELGAGKTTFAQGFAQGLGIKEKIISPTFVLIRQHKLPNSKKILFHIDLYRLENEKELKGLGVEETWSDEENIVLIEWAEKIKKILPKNIVQIIFKKLSPTKREIMID